jgi:hypothetical protein
MTTLVPDTDAAHYVPASNPVCGSIMKNAVWGILSSYYLSLSVAERRESFPRVLVVEVAKELENFFEVRW